MSTSDYHFVTTWRVEATAGEVADVLADPVGLARWWPSVYLDVQELAPADAHGVGRRARLVTKGWLPYTLRWELEVVESRDRHGFTIVATGDFDGRGVWTFEQSGRFVDITYDWRIRAEKPLLRRLSFVLKPIFAANHRWAMAQGEESLVLELRRRRALSAAARAEVPAPPGPITYAAVGVVAGVAALAAGVGYLVVRWARRTFQSKRPGT